MNSFKQMNHSLEIIAPKLSDKKRIYSFLKKVDNQYHTPLSKRVSLNSYAEKLALNAFNFFLTETDLDIAHAAIYYNELESSVFLSNIAILEEYAGYRLGGFLLEEIELFSIEKKAKLLSLEADSDSDRLKKFYMDRGFEIISSNRNMSFFTKQLTY